MELVCPICTAVNRVPDARLEEAPKCGKCHGPLIARVPVELRSDTFDRFTTRHGQPVLVDFWASWCGPCKMMAPVFTRAAAEHSGRVLFGKLDTDAEGDIAQRYGIRSIPTLILFQDGQERARVSGALDGTALSRWIGQHC